MPVAALGVFIADLKIGLPELGHILLTPKTDPPHAVTTFSVFHQTYFLRGEILVTRVAEA